MRILAVRPRARALLSFAIGALGVSTVAACSLLVPLSDYDADAVDGAAEGSLRDGASDATATTAGDAGSAIDGGLEAAPGTDAQPPPLSAYARAVLADQPLLYVRLDDSDATSAPTALGLVDAGVARSSSIPGGAYIASAVDFGVPGALVGDRDRAVHLNGNLVGDFAISLGSSALYALNGGASYSLEIWALPDATDIVAPAYGRFFSGDEGFDQSRQAFTGGLVGDQLFAERIVSGDTNNNVYTSSLSLLDAAAPFTWIHCVVTYDAALALLSVYANGSPVGSVTTDGGDLDFTQATVLVLGGEPGDNDAGNHKPSIYYGALDEFALYTHVLDGSAIARHYQVGTGTTP